jgi:hypothetical protein
MSQFSTSMIHPVTFLPSTHLVHEILEPKYCTKILPCSPYVFYITRPGHPIHLITLTILYFNRIMFMTVCVVHKLL